MNSIDIVCLIIILVMTLIGIWHGFLRGIFHLLAWGAAIAGAYFAKTQLSDIVSNILQTSPFSTTLVCICLGFLVPFLALLFASHMVNKAITGTTAGKADRILGGIFGVIKALLICFVLLTILHILPFGKTLQEPRDASVAYAAYKSSLEMMGYSSEPVDLVGVAERKASEFTQSLTNKATEKATEAAKEAVNGAIKETSEKVLDSAKAVAKKRIDEISDQVKE